MRRWLRFVPFFLLIWFLTAWLSWFFFDFEDKFVRTRKAVGYSFAQIEQDSARVQSSLRVLQATPIWGVLRNGQPFPQKQSKEEHKMIDWSVAASVNRNKERYILLRIEKEPLKHLKEGDFLPDGSLILNISSNGYKAKAPDGVVKVVPFGL